MGDLAVDGKVILKWILKEKCCENVDWIDLSQDRDHWGAFSNTAINL
jgi:hypothetical protein